MNTTIDIASLMDDKNISQRNMADILGVSQSYVSEIKNGRKPLSKKHEELLILQFGQEVCDTFRVAKVDNRIMPPFKGSINGGKQQLAQKIEDSTSSNSNFGHDELIKLRTEAENHEKELINKDSYYKAIIEGKNNELAEKNARIMELQKMIEYLMDKK